MKAIYALTLTLALAQTDPAALSREAKQALAARDFGRAADLYGQLSRAMPGVAGLRLNLGIALFSAGRLEPACAEFRNALRMDPSLTPASLFLGLALSRLGRHAEAIAPLDVALHAEPNNAAALAALGASLLAANQFARASDQFRRLSQLEPRNPAAWRGLGLAAAARSRAAFARLAPDSAQALILVARARMDEGKDATAYTLLRRALALDAKVAGAHALLAEVYRRTGHADWANAVDVRETPPPAGPFADAVAASAEAAEAFARLAELPESAELHETESDAARLRGAFAESVTAMRKAAALRPDDARIERELARSLWLAEDYAAALPLLEKHHLDFEWGAALLALGKATEAIAPLTRARAFGALGRAYLAAGQPEQAIVPLRAALAGDDDGSIHFQLARACQRTGRADEARKMDAASERLRKALAEKQARTREMEIAAP